MTANSERPLRIGIDVRMTDASQGVRDITWSLVDALWKLHDGEERYVLLGYYDNAEEFYKYRNDQFSFFGVGDSPRASRWKARLKSRVLSSTLIHELWKNVNSPFISAGFRQPASPRGFDELGLDVVHFVSPRAFITRVPSIYHQYDLQHLHFPQFFTAQQIAFREARFRTFCRQASLVVVMTSWAKRDLIKHYAVKEDRVAVIPCAPVRDCLPSPSAPEIEDVRTKFQLPGQFILYPAQTFRHKNHLALLEALALLRDRYSIKVPLVCSGRCDEFFPRIQSHVRELQLDDQVFFLGLVGDREVKALYLLATLLIFPSLFEGWGLPVTEALASGLPICCADIETLRSQAGDAALYFDPADANAIAAAISDLWQAPRLRERLAEKGNRRAALFSWERIARTLRAHYRRIACRRLTAQDEELLCVPSLV